MSAAEEMEAVNHPAHYGGANNPYEAIKVIRAWGVGFAIGNALKYLCRAGKKPGQSQVQDLEKAVWYIQSEIDAIKQAEVKQTPAPKPVTLAMAMLDGGRPQEATS